jgi:hypothetical protein
MDNFSEPEDMDVTCTKMTRTDIMDRFHCNEKESSMHIKRTVRVTKSKTLRDNGLW